MTKTHKLYKLETGAYGFAGYLNLDALSLARSVALEHHGDQRYGSHPYIWHLDSVVESLKSDSWVTHSEVNVLVVGMLHDILEDCSSTIDENDLADLFDTEVAQDVVALTKVPGETYEAYIIRVASRNAAWIVKVHDTLCNLKESVRAHQADRVQKYTTQLQKLYAARSFTVKLV